MPRGRPMEPAVLTDGEESRLLSLASSRSLPHGLVQRAQIVLACARGEASASIARRMGLCNVTVGKWRKRYRMQGIEGLHDELRAGRPRTHDDERVAEVIDTALQTKPPDGSTHWSVRTMAEQTGVSKSTVQRRFSLFAVQPHRRRHVKLSNDPFFVDKMRDIDANVPEALDIHLIVDIDATHKHPTLRAWLARRPRYHIHYTPTYASRLNQVERRFGIITQMAIRRGSFSNVRELVNKIDLFVEHYNASATPFVWIATAESILAEIQRLCS